MCVLSATLLTRLLVLVFPAKKNNIIWFHKFCAIIISLLVPIHPIGAGSQWYCNSLFYVFLFYYNVVMYKKIIYYSYFLVSLVVIKGTFSYELLAFCHFNFVVS